MKKYLIALMIAFSGSALVLAEAEARRLGGGGSFGRQAPTFSRPAPQQSTAPVQQATPAQGRAANQPGAPAPASPWRNMLGGALLGLGLGALLAQFGIGGALASIIATVLMIGLLVLAAALIYRILRGKSPAPAYASHQAGHYSGAGWRSPEIGSRLEPQLDPVAFRGPPAGSPEISPASLPADFDEQAFVRNAKTYFLRLQAAWDRADVKDIREFTTPEMFAELRMQLQERGASQNHTDVVSLNAHVLGVEKVGDDYVVSVRFSGMIKEDENAQPEAFSEIWNLSKPVSGGEGWVLAGIQQVT